MKYATDNKYDKLKQQEFAKRIGFSIERKDDVLNYMRKCGKCAYTTALVKDVYEAKTVVGLIDDCYSDGIYKWYESDIYHFEKYNMKLNDDFVDYVLSKMI